MVFGQALRNATTNSPTLDNYSSLGNTNPNPDKLGKQRPRGSQFGVNYDFLLNN